MAEKMLMLGGIAIYAATRSIKNSLVLYVFRQSEVVGGNRSGAAHDGERHYMTIVRDADRAVPKKPLCLNQGALLERRSQPSRSLQFDEIEAHVLDFHQFRFQLAGRNEPRIAFPAAEPVSRSTAREKRRLHWRQR